MMDSDSSDEDIEEKLRLSEAVVNVTLKGANTTVSTNHLVSDEKIPCRRIQSKGETSKPSLRLSAINKDSEDTFTPGVKKFVASKLCEELDRKIELTDCFINGTSTDTTDSGIKLFSSSRRKLLTAEDNTFTTRIQKQKRKYSTSSNSSEENERLTEAAVSHDFIMEQSRLSSFTDKNGGNDRSEIVPTETDNIKQGCINLSVFHDNEQLDKNAEAECVKKKRKKNKKHKEEIKVS